jgi:guanylate kinase
MKAPGPLLIVSGPSGTGKTTVIKRLLALGDLPLHLSVSATTRPPRPGEQEGVDYYFWDPGRFRREVDAGAFLEWAKVHGHCYGTLRREVDDYRNRGAGVILDIDVQGAEQVRRRCPDHVSVFLEAPSAAAYEERLRQRGTESEAAIQKRLAAARGELARAGEYHYRVVNDDVDAAAGRLHAILRHQFEGDEHAG